MSIPQSYSAMLQGVLSIDSREISMALDAFRICSAEAVQARELLQRSFCSVAVPARSRARRRQHASRFDAIRDIDRQLAPLEVQCRVLRADRAELTEEPARVECSSDVW